MEDEKQAPTFAEKVWRADLSKSLLIGADLTSAHLDNVNLAGTVLVKADLDGALFWTMEQFDSAATLEATTMPNGVLLGGPGRDGPTYNEWKAQYLARVCYAL